MDSIKEDIPTHARTAHKGLLQKRLEEDLCWIVPHVPLKTHLVKGEKLTSFKCVKVCHLYLKKLGGGGSEG